MCRWTGLTKPNCDGGREENDVSDDYFKNCVAIPATPGWIGLWSYDGGVVYCGNVIAWVLDPKTEDPEPTGITEYGEASIVISPDGFVTRTGVQTWQTVAEFLMDKLDVSDETKELLKRRFDIKD